MKCRLIGLVILLLFSINSYCQDSYMKTLGKVDLGLSGLGLSVETPLSEKFLLDIGAGVGASYKVDEDFKYHLRMNAPAFYATLHGKYYYNRQDRIDHGRPIKQNAGNFFSAKVKYTSRTLSKQRDWNTLLIGCHWGMQRKLGKYFLYQFYIGAGAGINLEKHSSTHLTLFPDANIQVSYVLPFGKRK